MAKIDATIAEGNLELKIREFIDALSNRLTVTENMLDGNLVLHVYTDATRPAARTEGRMIYNSDTGQLNIDTGSDWTLPDGTVI